MEEETRSQPGDIDPVRDAASVHQEPQIDTAEPHTADISHNDNAVNTSMMSNDKSIEADGAETVDEDGEGTGTADKSIMSNNDNSQFLHDISYAQESGVEEEEGSVHADTEFEQQEHSILPSIESDTGDYTHDISVLDDSLLEDDRSSHRGSSRRDSGRTAALIQQAARDILAEIEAQRHDQPQEEQENEGVLGSQGDVYEDHYDRSGASMTETQEDSYTEDVPFDESRVEHDPNEDLEADQSCFEETQLEDPEAQHTVDEGGETSSQHGTDEDVFSEKSTRSSLGSYDGGSESGKRKAIRDNIYVTTRAPRVSDISQYSPKEDDFIPTIRGAPRPPFRSPSDVRAMQMASPPTSVFGSVIGSPRSGRRHFPTVSRLGSPSPSTQYSPKNRTPSRFRAKEAPLVLLHVTLLPLRWMWGDIINSFDAADMSEEAKTLRDSWRMLQDRLGSTVVERGILLGHPQNDYEILEERLLEALDLPMRRRARILQCGHYLGPANENTLVDDSDSEDGYDMVIHPMKQHWCGTCQNEIRCDSLGPGKIFRVKVYASNGLMKAGAWDACWKEMERVDIELEPVVEPGVSGELSRLAAAQREREAASSQQIELAAEILQQIEDQVDEQMNQTLDQQPDLVHAQLEITPPYPQPQDDQTSFGEDRRRRDEEHLREIYGGTPNPGTAPRITDAAAHQPHPDSYIPPPSPRSPSVEAYERRQARRQSLQSASFFELLTQSARVLMQDTRNIFIVGLSVMVLLMALRAPQQTQPDTIVFENKSTSPVSQVPILEAPVTVPDQASAVIPIESSSVAMHGVATHPGAGQESMVPEIEVYFQQPPVALPAVHQVQSVLAIEPDVTRLAQKETDIQRTTLRVIETVTETETLKVQIVTETETMKVKATVTATDVSETSEPTVEPTIQEFDSSESLDGLADVVDTKTLPIIEELADSFPVPGADVQMDEAPIMRDETHVEQAEQADNASVVDNAAPMEQIAEELSILENMPETDKLLVTDPEVQAEVNFSTMAEFSEETELEAAD